MNAYSLLYFGYQIKKLSRNVYLHSKNARGNAVVQLQMLVVYFFTNVDNVM